jgi:hypothetical protein
MNECMTFKREEYVDDVEKNVGVNSLHAIAGAI